MNEAFFALPEEKRQRILNAALEAFAKHEYKKASTDDIAAKAGISKGLLFYYFHNTKELYLYLLEYANEAVRRAAQEANLREETDFFEMLEKGARAKTGILEQNPYLLDFTVRSFYSSQEEVSQAVAASYQQKVGSAFPDYFSHIDFSKFREGADPAYLFRMLTWMTDGYMHEARQRGIPVDSGTVMEEFRRWSQIFRRMVYREEETGGAPGGKPEEPAQEKGADTE